MPDRTGRIRRRSIRSCCRREVTVFKEKNRTFSGIQRNSLPVDMIENATVPVVAIGQDSHRFELDTAEKPLILGGVPIPDSPGLKGNSDADVILHALCNALSGLSGVPVLGPVADKLCQDQGITDSSEYVRKAISTLQSIRLTHVSISVEAGRPHLHSHCRSIRESVARLLSLPIGHVGLTATSGEGLTAFGRGEGIQVSVIVSACREL